MQVSSLLLQVELVAADTTSSGIVREFVTGGFKMRKNSRILTIL